MLMLVCRDVCCCFAAIRKPLMKHSYTKSLKFMIFYSFKMEKYHVIDVIGEGSFGKVYKARKKFSGQIVAIKFIPKRGKMDKELKNIKREIDIIKKLKHPYIIEMLDTFETPGELVMVTDYAEGELFRILQDDKVLPVETVGLI